MKQGWSALEKRGSAWLVLFWLGHTGSPQARHIWLSPQHQSRGHFNDREESKKMCSLALSLTPLPTSSRAHRCSIWVFLESRFAVGCLPKNNHACTHMYMHARSLARTHTHTSICALSGCPKQKKETFLWMFASLFTSCLALQFFFFFK